MFRLSIVIPAYNEEKSIVQTIDSLRDALSDHVELQFLIVDDHSDDNTIGLIRELGQHDVNCIRLSRRSGSHTAMRAGLAQVDGDIALCIAADGQEDPTAVSEMVDKWKDGAHIVWGTRISRDNELLSYKCIAGFFYWLLKSFATTNATDIDLNRADFFLLDRKVVDAVNKYSESNTSFMGLLCHLGFKHEQVDYERRSRLHGESKWNFNSRLKLAMDWLIAFSGAPLKLLTVAGISISLLAFLYGLFLVISYFASGSPVQGWTSLTVLITFLAGLQLFGLGLIGEYLGRTLDESRKRPLYFIEQNTTDE